MVPSFRSMPVSPVMALARVQLLASTLPLVKVGPVNAVYDIDPSATPTPMLSAMPNALGSAVNAGLEVVLYCAKSPVIDRLVAFVEHHAHARVPGPCTVKPRELDRLIRIGSLHADVAVVEDDLAGRRAGNRRVVVAVVVDESERPAAVAAVTLRRPDIADGDRLG